MGIAACGLGIWVNSEMRMHLKAVFFSLGNSPQIGVKISPQLLNVTVQIRNQ